MKRLRKRSAAACGQFSRLAGARECDGKSTTGVNKIPVEFVTRFNCFSKLSSFMLGTASRRLDLYEMKKNVAVAISRAGSKSKRRGAIIYVFI